MILALLALLTAPVEANWNRVQYSQPDAALFVATYLHTGLLDSKIPDSGFSYYLTVIYSDYKRMLGKNPIIYSRSHDINEGSDKGHKIAIRWVKERVSRLQSEYERENKHRLDAMHEDGYLTQDELDEKHR